MSAQVTNKQQAAAQFPARNRNRVQLIAQRIRGVFSGRPAPARPAVAGGIADDADQPLSMPADLQALYRNSYIIIGMLGGIVLLLLMIMGLMFWSRRQGGVKVYRSVIH